MEASRELFSLLDLSIFSFKKFALCHLQILAVRRIVFLLRTQDFLQPDVSQIQESPTYTERDYFYSLFFLVHPYPSGLKMSSPLPHFAFSFLDDIQTQF